MIYWPQRRGGAEKMDLNVQDVLLYLAIDPRYSLRSRCVVAPSRFMAFFIPLLLRASASPITSSSSLRPIAFCIPLRLRASASPITSLSCL